MNCFSRTDCSSMAQSNNLPRLAPFSHLLWQLSLKDWVVYAKPPFGGAEHVLNYLAHYTHRVAISNHRLVAFENDRVSFRWRDYAHGGKKKIMTVSARGSCARFLLHVLPGDWCASDTSDSSPTAAEVLRSNVAALCSGTTAYIDPPDPPGLRCPACSGLMFVVDRLHLRPSFTSSRTWPRSQAQGGAVLTAHEQPQRTPNRSTLSFVYVAHMPECALRTNFTKTTQGAYCSSNFSLEPTAQDKPPCNPTSLHRVESTTNKAIIPPIEIP